MNLKLPLTLDLVPDSSNRTFPIPYHLIPMSENEANRSKYLYIARNPKDAAISFYHFVSSFGPASHFSGTWEFFAKLLIEGKGINSVKYLLEYADID